MTSGDGILYNPALVANITSGVTPTVTTLGDYAQRLTTYGRQMWFNLTPDAHNGAHFMFAVK